MEALDLLAQTGGDVTLELGGALQFTAIEDPHHARREGLGVAVVELAGDDAEERVGRHHLDHLTAAVRK